MTKDELATKVAQKCGLSHSDALCAIEGMMTVMSGAFSSGENIYLRGFGTFKIVLRQAKNGRDISRNQEVSIPEHHAVKFIPCSRLKERVRKSNRCQH